MTIEKAAAIDQAPAHARRLMAALGLPLDAPGLADTPARLVSALYELTAGMREDPGRHLEVTFPAESAQSGVIAVTDLPFISLCEHHLLPFTGSMTVAYLPSPGAPIVGLSKLARMAQGFAARPQVQERLGEQIVESLCARLDCMGAACQVVAEHSCMTLRGVRAAGAKMTTLHLKGVFERDTLARRDFMGLCRA
ncbi:GTP cyclohydrolase I [Nonomuraea sp. FMUSA5-5]|uniref:GTP cyclohydrolase 1 n=1 Tax=Nonomuraea composti TaxID=2720023 RepID=A0ABX1BDS3_9ACTN|nr:GTP cyclohydrolase I [Nonomuraea sp. FMUSA5-5]NJP93889.1 GTP cyclohydrolase I [Nonomuraea sp. FMUSA5-5]